MNPNSVKISFSSKFGRSKKKKPCPQIQDLLFMANHFFSKYNLDGISRRRISSPG